MNMVRAVAWHTFLEAARDKVLYLLVFFGVFVFGVSRLLSPLALGEGRRVTIDVGLASVSIFGCLLVIFVGHQLIFREVERKTLYFLFARPIRRGEFVVGKFCGLALILAAAVAAMGALFLLLLFCSGYAFGGALFQAFLLVWIELSVLAGLAVLIASFTSPVLAGLFTLAAYLIGHGSGDLSGYAETLPDPVARGAIRAMLFVTPRLDLYHDTTPILLGSHFPSSAVWFATFYAGAYVGACLFLASLVLSRRELSL